MKHLIRLILISAIFLFIALWAVLYFFNDGSYFDLQSDEFSHFVAPVVTLLSVFLLIYTLAETKKTNEKSKEFNENQLALNEYNIYRNEISLIEKDLKESRFDISTVFSDRLNNIINNINGINYIDAFREILLHEIKDPDDYTPESKLSTFSYNVIKPLMGFYEKLYLRLIEIEHNETLSSGYKSKLYKRIKVDILEDYLHICNRKKKNGEPIFDLEKFVTKNYNIISRFRKLNYLIKSIDNFTLND